MATTIVAYIFIPVNREDNDGYNRSVNNITRDTFKTSTPVKLVKLIIHNNP